MSGPYELNHLSNKFIDAEVNITYLIYGYVRCLQIFQIIPSTILQLCRNFYFEIYDYYWAYEWQIEQSVVLQMINAKNKQEFESQPFEIKETKWVLQAYPNGRTPEQLGSFSLRVKLLSIPSTWERLIVSRKIYCDQFQIEQHDTAPYKKVAQSHGWAVNTLLLHEIQHEKQLNFKVILKVLKIILNETNSNNVIYDCEHIKMVKKLQIKWDINSKLIDKFKNEENTKFFNSPIYNEMWSIGCAPNGWNKKTEGKCIFFLEICALPSKTTFLKANYKINVHEMNHGMEDTHDFDYSHSWNWGRAVDDSLSLAQMKEFNGDKLTVTADITILNVHDHNGRDVTDTFNFHSS